jgi:tetratricopeptide (TPR) repeat protein
VRHRHIDAAAVLERGGAGPPDAGGCTRCERVLRTLELGHAELAALRERRPAPGRGARVRDDAAGPLELAARAEAIADELVSEFEAGDEHQATYTFFRYDGHPALPFAAVYACQRLGPMGLSDPAKALSFATVVGAFASTLKDRDLRRLVKAEADILESPALEMQGSPAGATRAASRALRALVQASAPALSVARARYLVACGLAAQGELRRAERAFARARDAFADAGQDHWVGRAEAGSATALLRAGDRRAALERFDSAVAHLDEQTDGPTLASVLLNRAGVLADLGSREEARGCYKRSAQVALRSGAAGIAVTARVGMLEMSLEDGRVNEVATLGERVLARDDIDQFATAAFFCRLLVAEAHAARGSYGRARALLQAVRRSIPPELASAEVLELARLEPSDAEMLVLLTRVRQLVAGHHEDAAKRA